MWHQLNPAERAKFLGTAMMSVSLLAMAAAIAYFSYTLFLTQQNIPAILALTEQTTKTVSPALEQVEPIRKMIPQILEEVAALRKQVPPLLEEVAATREALPAMLDTTSKTVHEATTSINKLEPHISPTLTEVRKTRQALPGLMDRAEEIVASAGKAGQEASKGAVFGIVGGVLAAPFKLIGGVGKGLAHAIGIDKKEGFTEQDEKLASKATDSVIRSGEEGKEVSWENPESKNRGTVRLLSQKQRDEQSCYLLRQEVVLASGKKHKADVEFCQNPDGSWTQYKG